MNRFEEMTKGYSQAQEVLSGITVALGATLRVPGQSALILELGRGE